MNKLELIKYDETYSISLEIGKYSNGNMAIIMLEGEYSEPYANLTVNIDQREKDCALIDTNNLGYEIVDWIVENGLGEPTWLTVDSGYCSYPEIRFNMDRLKEVSA